MKMKKSKDPRKKKMLLVFPVLIIPFLTMAFWGLGGGKAEASNTQKQATGLNLQLPNAQLKDEKGENKLSYYEQAEKDSQVWKEKMENDPFFKPSRNDSTPKENFNYDPYPLKTGDYKDSNEQKVYRKLTELNSHLQNPNGYTYGQSKEFKYSSDTNPSFKKEDVDRLEKMMKTVSSPDSKDPEVEQLNGMMNRILDIQHPERLKQRRSENAAKDKERVYKVNTKEDPFTVSLLDTNKTGDHQTTAFYTVDDFEDDHEKCFWGCHL